MNPLTIDFARVLGPIKPLHGVNNGPVTCNFRYDATPYFQEAGIPFSRLHDTEYPFGAGEFLDVNCLFPNFSRDPADASAYRFALNDAYLQHIADAGARIIYRLGCTIEHQPTKRYVFPPQDALKWAQVCEHIILHCNEGWANGLHLNIAYWEIWNEPDGILWNGTPESYYEFFAVVCKYLKARFPHLKFGGPALCVGSNPFAEGMMDYLAADSGMPPLDFYSWHTYASTPEEFIRQASAARSLLDRHGFTEAESILDEWNYVRTWDEVGMAWQVIQSAKGAAFNAAVLSALQNTSCDIATYYDAQMVFQNWWNGLFAPAPAVGFFEGTEEVRPKKGYYALRAFGRLYRLGSQVYASEPEPGIYALAASNGREHAVLLTNYQDEAEQSRSLTVEFQHNSARHSQLYLLDTDHDLEPMEHVFASEMTLELPPNAVVLLEMTP